VTPDTTPVLGAMPVLGAAPDVAAFRRSVLGFGRRHLRALPWRQTRDPWAVLVSEMMLQQTPVDRVLGPYQSFLARFGSPQACATAPVSEVVRAWAGLGYNRRAVYLHRAADMVVERHGGVVPGDLDALRALDGVGPYTARAVLAFAFERDVAVVDVNVARVLSRVVGRRLPASGSACQAVADSLLAKGKGWLWNQSLLEMGALVCTARSPSCSRCPLVTRCRWARQGRPRPDPGEPTSRQSTFEGSDRQGRGRLLTALRHGPVTPRRVPIEVGWPEDPERARRVAQSLVTDGLARRGPGGVLTLP
jgi:A/G-specific adenine glycosylase